LIIIGGETISGSLIVSSSTTSSAFIGSGSNILTVDGVSGRLFSVSDSFSGSLFSVNTIAGLPIMEVFSDNTVRIGQFGTRALFVSQSRVGIGKETSINSVLDISGSVIVTGSITGSLFGTSSYAVQALSASWAPGGGGSAPTAVTFNRVTASYTFALTDAGKTVEVSGSTNTTYNLTVPPASTTNFADGTFIDVVLYGTGSIQFVTGSGVTFRSANSWAKLGTRYGAATIINISGDEWYLIGNLNA
jgi:hypothetical protein